MAGETTAQTRAGANVKKYTPHAREMACARGTFEITTGELELNDIIQLEMLPKGAIIVGGFLTVDDLDSHACPTLTLDVGTGDDPNGLLSASTIGQGGGHADFNGDLLKDGSALTADDTVDLKASAAAATAAGGTVTYAIYYITDD